MKVENYLFIQPVVYNKLFIYFLLSPILLSAAGHRENFPLVKEGFVRG